MELESKIRQRFLERLDNSSWQDSDPSLDFGENAIPYFIQAFSREQDYTRRARLVRIVGEFRSEGSLPFLR